MPIESIFALCAAVFVFSLKPGPGILTAMSHSVSNGFFGLAAFTVGFSIGLFVYLAIVFFGLMSVQHFEIDMVFLAILAKSFAALYMIFLGIQEIKNYNIVIDPKNALAMDKAKSFLDIAASAIILTISNPMIIVFYAALIPTFIDPQSLYLGMALVVMALLIVIDAFGMWIYCTPLILFRKTLPKSLMKYLKLISGVVIILIGLYIGYTAIQSQDVLAVF